MQEYNNLYILTADLGYKFFDDIARDFPDRFFNVGASEQLLLGAAVGLTQENKIPICYSITPFLLYGGGPFIRNYLNYENKPVKLLGGGRDKDYSHDGFSHDASDHLEFVNLFPNIVKFIPNSSQDLPIMLKEFIENGRPSYMNLRR